MSLTCFQRNELSLFSLIAFSKKTFLAVRIKLFVLLRQSLNFPSLASYDNSPYFSVQRLSLQLTMRISWTRLMRFSLIGSCLLRTDKNSAFHVEKFIFESDCIHLNFSISVLRSSKNAES